MTDKFIQWLGKNRIKRIAGWLVKHSKIHTLEEVASEMQNSNEAEVSIMPVLQCTAGKRWYFKYLGYIMFKRKNGRYRLIERYGPYNASAYDLAIGRTRDRLLETMLEDVIQMSRTLQEKGFKIILNEEPFNEEKAGIFMFY